MFSYCNNNAVNFIDNQGTDAVWVHEGDSAGRFGHSGLLVEDGEGNWYFFYWGPVDEDAPLPELLAGTAGRCVVFQLKNVDDGDVDSTAEVIEVLENSGDVFVTSRSSKVTSTTYLEGSFELTYAYIKILEGLAASGLLQYNLTKSNCVEHTCMALAASDPSYLTVMDVVPDVAYAKLKCKVIADHVDARPTMNPMPKVIQ